LCRQARQRPLKLPFKRILCTKLRAPELLGGSFPPCPARPQIHYLHPLANRLHSRAPVTEPQGEPPVARARRRPPRLGPLLLLVGLALAVLVGWYLLSRPRLAFSNGLAAPIWIAVGRAAPISIAPGETRRLALSRNGSVVVQWNLARPLSADERPMGEELRGSEVMREPRGLLYRSATNRGTGIDYFAPLITNATSELLRVTVNAGLEGALDCGCGVRPGARRVFIGYYRLYGNSTVRVRDSLGRSAIFRDLGPSVITPDGTVGLRFESKDLR
jgi:hypothetical protein